MYFALRRQGVELWSVRSGRLDLLRAALEGERATDESARKSQAMRAGLQRRKESGKPVGPLPLGYRVERTVAADETVIARRVPDPVTAPVVVDIFEWIEQGATPGEVARRLNAAGVKTRRGKSWEARAVRRIAENPVFGGEGSYPALVSAEQAADTRASLSRVDPAAGRRRSGGRLAADRRSFLRGLGFCFHCGAALWTRPLAAGRVYICRNVRQATGLCDAEAIPAELIEGHVLAHFEAFVGSAERWLDERRGEHRRALVAQQDAVRRHRRALENMDRQRQALMASYRDQVAEGRSTARLALEAVERLDAERAEQAQHLANAEAVAAEHDTDQDVAHTEALVASFRERITNADSAPALNRALAASLAGLWAFASDGHLHAEFELADPLGLDGQDEHSYLRTHALPVVPGDESRLALPPAPSSAPLRPGERCRRGWCTSIP